MRGRSFRPIVRSHGTRHDAAGAAAHEHRHLLYGRAMSCNIGSQLAWHGLSDGHGMSDPAFKLHCRGAGLPLTSLKRWYARSSDKSGNLRCAAARAVQPDKTDARATLADTLLGSVAQTLTLGMSAATLANDSLARLQRIVGPLPPGFPPGGAITCRGAQKARLWSLQRLICCMNFCRPKHRCCSQLSEKPIGLHRQPHAAIWTHNRLEARR